MKKIAIILMTILFMATSVFAMGHHQKKDKTAIVVAAFGTTYMSGLSQILNIYNTIKKEFPHTKVAITFTSNIIRNIWKKRQSEAQKWLNKGVPKEVLYVKNMIATVGDLIEDGYKTIIIQPLHITYGEEYFDVLSYAKGLRSIQTIKKKWMPIHKIVVGRPLLGTFGPRYDYHEDIKIAVESLKDDIMLAKKHNACLVYMGHGNEYFSTGLYAETQKEFRKMYPDVKTYIGTVEGYPSLDDLVVSLKHCNKKNIVLKPFMIVAGDHANNDMAGPDKDSWKNVISAQGFHVIPILKGLGAKKKIAEIYVQHIKDVARDNGITLK